MNKPFRIKYDWGDFDDTSRLTSYQKYKIKKRYKKEIKFAIQKVINDSISDREKRREELDEHKDPDNPFRLDFGGEG